MNKKVLVFLLLLMSLSLIGIIFVQGFWIKNAMESKEAQFTFNAKQLLIEVSNKLEEDEFENYFFTILDEIDSLGKPQKVTVDELLRIQQNGDNTYLYTNSVIQEDYKLFSPFLIGNKDSIEFRRLINKKVTRVVRENELEGNKLSAEQKFIRVNELDGPTRQLVSNTIKELAADVPIYKRVNKDEVRKLIKEQLEKRNLDTDFEFGFYSNGLATKVKTEDFKLNGPSTYGIAIFDTDDETINDHNYQLMIDFTGKGKEVWSAMGIMISLSVIFTLIIVFTYISALFQLFRQRQISQIKTDFINNMTHEFKTPIATINLILDSVKNPKIFQDEEKIKRYMNMIRDENERMHSQVENVLRISKLEKNELNIKKERLNLNDILTSAIAHMELILKEHQGEINTHLQAKNSFVLANKSHLTNVLVNILDNAVKYSINPPEIDIYTENARNYILLKIKDNGIGMSKSVQRKIFEKFFREHTGNVHNVKGHGLGLAYVKRILEDHHAQIFVESQKGKGSTFIIKLPLIS
ncbi:MAG TPA: HAMP domain-containing sensor histidine kinase [Flavobacteriaceae bacterium]|nr:HAMP domain-containing sensor histidine kinase [Flavobacteriaceae bacterium]